VTSQTTSNFKVTTTITTTTTSGSSSSSTEHTIKTDVLLQWSRRSIVGFLLLGPWFADRKFYLGFVYKKVALRWVTIRIICFSDVR